MVGFCKVDVKLFGPLHEYEAPATVVTFKLMVLPSHTGLVPPAVIAGVRFTVTEVVPAVPVQPLTVTVTE